MPSHVSNSFVPRLRAAESTPSERCVRTMVGNICPTPFLLSFHPPAYFMNRAPPHSPELNGVAERTNRTIHNLRASAHRCPSLVQTPSLSTISIPSVVWLGTKSPRRTVRSSIPRLAPPFFYCTCPTGTAIGYGTSRSALLLKFPGRPALRQPRLFWPILPPRPSSSG